MPLAYRRVSETEKENLFPKRGQMDLAEYEAIFREAIPGDAFEIDIDGMTPRALKRRLGQAAKHVHGTGTQLRYVVGEKTIVCQLSTSGLARRSPGRPKKADAE